MKFVQSVCKLVNLATILGLLISSCSQEDSQFSVVFQWAVDTPTPGEFEVRGILKLPDGGRLTSSPPTITYFGPNTEISFQNVPFGEDRIVEIAFYPVDGANQQPRYFGQSAPFSFKAGQNLQVPVAINLVDAPGLIKPQSAETLRVVNAQNGRVSTPELLLEVTARGAEGFEVAQNFDFAVGEVQILNPQRQNNSDTFRFSYNLNSTRDECDPDKGGNPQICEGLRRIFVRATRNDLKSGASDTSVTLDTTAPLAFDLEFSPPAARIDTEVLLSFTATEPLATTSTAASLVFEWVAEDPGFTFFRADGTRYTYRLIVDPANFSAESLFELRALNLTDLVGNNNRVEVSQTENGPVLTVDSSKPQISLRVTPERVGPTGTISAVVNINEPIADRVGVRIGSLDFTCTPSNPKVARCTYQLKGNELSNSSSIETLSVVASVADLAGNASTSEQPIILDFRPPIVRSAQFSPSRVRLGIDTTLLITLDESLDSTSGNPVLFWGTSGNPGFTQASIDGNTLVYNLSITDSIAEGTYELIGFEGTDVVGNRARVSLSASLLIDSSIPTITISSISPQQANQDDTVQVRFSISEPIPLSQITARLDGSLMTCSPINGQTEYTCSLRPTRPNTLFTKNAFIDLEAVDTAGNVGRASNSTILDFEPPSITNASIRYQTNSNNQLDQVQVATGAQNPGSTKVFVTISFSEEIDTANLASSFTASNGSSTMRFSLPASRASTTTFAEFEVDVSQFLHADGIYTGSITVQDVAGNRATLSVPVSINVDSTANTLLVAQNQVSYIRSPIGNASAETLLGANQERFTIPQGIPFFELGPPDGLDSVSRLPANTFQFRNGQTPSQIRIWGDANSENLLGSATPSRDANFRIYWDRSDLRLDNRDFAQVWVTGIDIAGNESAAVAIHNSWFVGSTANAGEESHEVQSASEAALPLAPQSRLSVAGTTDGLDNQVSSVRAEHVWTDRTTRTNPPSLGSHAMVYDSARGKVVLFGGQSPGRNADTWEWDGLVWKDVTPDVGNPPVRMQHAMAYDSARGVVVLFGGRDLESFADTWEWDGTTWREVTPPSGNPPARYRHAMVYDSSRRSILMFGGSPNNNSTLADTWAWDGSTWTNVTPSGSNPGARQEHAMAYDSHTARVLLFGGSSGETISSFTYNDLWSWNGSSWTPIQNFPPLDLARRAHDMVYDHANRRLVCIRRKFETS